MLEQMITNLKDWKQKHHATEDAPKSSSKLIDISGTWLDKEVQAIRSAGASKTSAHPHDDDSRFRSRAKYRSREIQNACKRA